MVGEKLRVGVLISGRGSNLQALIDACGQDGFPARIVLVISNIEGAYGLERARAAGIPTLVIRHKDYQDRAAFDAALTEALAAAQVGLVCLAGFMRLLDPAFVRHWEGRLINIHPSLLPAFRGLHTHERAIEAGVRFTGCTVHFVGIDVDDGPIIVQAAVPVLPQDDPDSLAARVLGAEHRIYPLAVLLIAEGRARLDGARVTLDGAAFSETILVNPSDR